VGALPASLRSAELDPFPTCGGMGLSSLNRDSMALCFTSDLHDCPLATACVIVLDIINEEYYRNDGWRIYINRGEFIYR
jgi:hypothetical protein